MRTYGEIKLSDGKIEIEAEPHVLGRLKRVFKKVDRHSSRITMGNTPENCFDMLWFMQRYPLRCADRTLLKANARYYREVRKRLDAMSRENYKPREFKLADCVEQREYQLRAAEIYLVKRSLLVADDVGLGKTAIAIFSFTEPKTLPALVVTLTHLPRQWESEINRFAPGISTHILKKGTPYKLPEFFGRPPDVLIVNYHKLAGWEHYLKDYVNSVTFDECQELRRTESNKYMAAQAIARNCKYKLGLSATPIYNYGIEFFNIMQVIEEDRLGAEYEFVNEWCDGYSYGGKTRVKEPKEFGSWLRENHIMIRRTRSDVGRELPDVSKVPYIVDSDEARLNEIKDSATELAKIILRKIDASKEMRFTASGQFDMLMRQATGIAKAPYVADFVKILCEGGEQVVLYGWHREVYNLWEPRLREYNPAWYTGSETPKKKDESKDAFLSGESRVLFMSLRSGLGLDGLQKVCRTVVFGELDWSPGIHEQCIGRIHRDGQKEKVVAYYLMAESGSDPIIAETLGIKREQALIVDPDKPLVEKLTRDHDGLRKLAQQYLEGK